MAASRYRKFLRLMEDWPADPSKRGRDLAVAIRERVAHGFRRGENSEINEKECDRMYDALNKIHTDFFREKYPRLKDSSATGTSVEICHMVMATDTITEMENMNKSRWQKIKESMPWSSAGPGVDKS
ncbi:ubiquinol-cytochrome c reductase complex assembly factor 2-like [Lytechinus pictus]|uniref:ubiquinol-cytochrome c reductase complex assembly factor 2-like n=1 Tax=Lytechinus pictus TaxID=7653 RepID=UPI00240DA460|nr:ubiquinol-cytochrome-c reductase complex assembly factor 2-like isoform X1 [Lytechinus pictus]